MNIEQLQYICAVAHNTSITTAAEKLFVTQQTVSKAINKLEKELGFQLLNRTSKGVTLTENGKIFVEKSEAILAQIQELYFINSPSSNQKEYQGEVKFYCSGYFSFRVAPNLVEFFAEHYPAVKLRMEEHTAKDTIDLVLETGQLGCITAFNEHAGYLPTDERFSRLGFFNVFDDEICIICSKKHPLASKDAVNLRDLGNYSVIVSNSPNIETVFSQVYDIDLNILMYTDYLTSNLDTIRSGSAISFGTISTLNSLNLDNDLVWRPIAERPVAKSSFVYPRKRDLSDLEKEIIRQSFRIFQNL